MNWTLRSIALIVFATSLCGCRELVSPKESYIIVPNVFSPVEIRTSGLEGSGWIKAMLPGSKDFTPIFIEPSGSFVYNQPLPGNVWHCADPGGHEGCVARLQAGDEKGALSTGVEDNAIYVCTENYVQRMGRKHCGRRTFEAWVISDDDVEDTVTLPKWGSYGPLDTAFKNDGIYKFHGDPTTRLISGTSWFPDADQYNPPVEDGTPSMWVESPWVPGEVGYISPDSGNPYSGNLYSGNPYSGNYVADIGMCSVFLPFKWEDHMNDGFANAIGQFTEYRGIAEILIDGILEDDSPPETRGEEDVFFWADATATVTTRKDVSPEVHFRLAPAVDGSGQLKPQLGVKTYFTVNNDIDGSVEDWYRWDQGFLGGFAEFFNIGECGSKPASLLYFGEIGMKNGRAYFKVAHDPIANVDEYPLIKVACRKTFRPKVIEGLQDGARTAGEENFTEGLGTLVQKFQDYVRVTLKVPEFQVRDLVLTSSGIYVITAKTAGDPQYKFGLGNCFGDLQAPKPMPALQPQIRPQYSNRGITREIP